MDPEQTFIRVQERFSNMLTPRIRVILEYLYLILAITLFCILVVMHANYVQQESKITIAIGNIHRKNTSLLRMKPGCSSELAEVEATEAQLVQIKITSAGLWSQNSSQHEVINVPVKETEAEILKVEDSDGLTLLAENFWLNWIGPGAKKGKLDFNFWNTDDEVFDSESESHASESSKPAVDNGGQKLKKDESGFRFPILSRESFKALIARTCRRWYRRLCFCWRHGRRILGGLWEIAGIHLNLDIPKWLHILHLDRLNLYAVQWLERKSKAFEPTYLYTMEKGYFLLPEGARFRHSIRSVNVSISARHPCFGNRWQQLMINRLVGYDTILMNSLLSYPGKGYLYNYQTKEFYNITYAHEQPDGSTKFGDYLVNKCGVLMMSLFVFFTTTMSVSFTLRETQTRMLKFTVQLQHHARHRLPTFQLIFVHVIESLVFVPIMIGILFFLFEFYDDQLLAFMVLILVWLCELFTLISVRTPISMKFFPRFFLLYFLVFHIYFFSYTYGFSYLALSTTAAFVQHLILYFWNRFEVPALQRFMQIRRSQIQQHPDFHITSSTILASTLHITRLNATRNVESDLTSGRGAPNPGIEAVAGGNPVPVPAPGPGTNMNSFSSLLLWILGGASSEGRNSFLSMFRDVREQGDQLYQQTPHQATPDAQ